MVQLPPTAVCGLFLVAFAACTPRVVEPPGYWMGEHRGPPPATVEGGGIIHTSALAALIKRDPVVIIDVAAAPKRPTGMASGMPWLPPPHYVVPGAVWLPGTGDGAISPALDRRLRERLAALTGGDLNRPIIVYCHPNCWLSWNATKRVISHGYRRVFWYPDGIDGWQGAGLPTVVATAEPQPTD